MTTAVVRGGSGGGDVMGSVFVMTGEIVKVVVVDRAVAMAVVIHLMVMVVTVMISS